MANEIKQLKKAYIEVIEDIFDNYDKYTNDEKVKVKQQLDHLEKLNDILEKYDTKKKKKWFEKIADWWNNSTGKK